MVTLHGIDVNVRQERYRSGEYGFWQRSYPDQFAVMARQRNVHFIAVLNALREAAIDYGVTKDRIVVRYTGIDLRKFQPGPKPIAKRPSPNNFRFRMPAVDWSGDEHQSLESLAFERTCVVTTMGYRDFEDSTVRRFFADGR